MWIIAASLGSWGNGGRRTQQPQRRSPEQIRGGCRAPASPLSALRSASPTPPLRLPSRASCYHPGLTSPQTALCPPSPEPPHLRLWRRGRGCQLDHGHIGRSVYARWAPPQPPPSLPAQSYFALEAPMPAPDTPPHGPSWLRVLPSTPSLQFLHATSQADKNGHQVSSCLSPGARPEGGRRPESCQQSPRDMPGPPARAIHVALLALQQQCSAELW